MKALIGLLFLAFALSDCKDNINDKGKRNENWVWWVDAKTGKGIWISVSNGELSVKNGKYTRFYFNENVFEKGKLINGQTVDTVFNYDINGRLQELRDFSKDTSEYFVINGPIKMYHPSGSIKAIGEVKDHYYGDNWISYFENGKPSYIRSLKQDTGWETRYYDNGSIKDSICVEGKKSFCVMHFYMFPAGQLSKTIGFKNHNYNGLQKEYYQNGRLKAECPVVNGNFIGRGTRWYESGSRQTVAYTKNGVLNGGPDTAFFESGKIQMIAYAKNGKLDGEVKKFDKDGKLIGDRIYKGGTVTEDKLILKTP